MTQRKRTLFDAMDEQGDSDDDVIILSPPVPISKARSKERKPVMKKPKLLTSNPTMKFKDSWITSSFGGFTSSSQSSGVKRKQKDASLALDSSGKPGKESVQQEDTMWSEKYQPKSETDLAVHKKKIADVRGWLLDNLCSTHTGPMLLLSGPVGAGKTATIQVLAQELNVELQEWSNPMTADFEQGEFSSGPRLVNYQSQDSLFHDFILRANKYPSLCMIGENNNNNNKQPHSVRKIILVEEFPNIYYRDVRKFHDILQKYRRNGRSPLVFIVSDSQKRNSALQKLFPKDVQIQLGICNISFNPVANTSLLKAINKIVSIESKKAISRFINPSKDTLDNLMSSCGGDIRAAVNALQFVCLKGSKNIKLPRKGSSQISKNTKKGTSTASDHMRIFQRKDTTKTITPHDETLASIGGKDLSVFLFRALGKVLYCKRDNTKQTVPSHLQLPEHLSQHNRDPLLFNPEEIVEHTQLSPEFFNLYLHQNYVEFFTDIDDLVSATEYFSDADLTSADWANRLELSAFSSSIATRGLMFSNKSRTNTKTGAVASGWRPLHKPQWLSTNKQTRENIQSARELFKSYHSCHVDLQTDILPYLALTDVPLKTPSHFSFLQSITQFPKSKSLIRFHTETLDEKDAGSDMDNEDDMPSQQPGGQPTPQDSQSTVPSTDSPSCSQTQVVQAQDSDEEDEDIIEDFDDD